MALTTNQKKQLLFRKINNLMSGQANGEVTEEQINTFFDALVSALGTKLDNQFEEEKAKYLAEVTQAKANAEKAAADTAVELNKWG